MIKIMVNESENIEERAILKFISNLSPELKDKFKTIILWESMKSQEVLKEEVKEGVV